MDHQYSDQVKMNHTDSSAANAGSADAQIAVDLASLNDAIEIMFDRFVIQMPPAITAVKKAGS